MRNFLVEEQKEKKEWKSEESPWDLYDTMKRNNIHIVWVPKREQKGIDSIFKVIMGENFLILGEKWTYRSIRSRAPQTGWKWI